MLQVSGVPGTFALYEILMQLPTDLNTDPASRMTVNQNSLISNLVIFPAVNPSQALTQETTAQKKPAPGQRVPAR